MISSHIDDSFCHWTSLELFKYFESIVKILSLNAGYDGKSNINATLNS